MKRSQVLFHQHIGRQLQWHWYVQGKKKILPTAAEQILKDKNIPIYKPHDILKEKRKFEKIEIIGYKDKPVLFDETHPDWHEKPILTYKDNNVLLEGLTQAKIITKSVEIKGLLDAIILKEIPNEIHKNVKNIILSSKVFDAEQKKLPKIKDPERPAWNFPRSYGITQNRANKLIISKLLQLIESMSCPKLVSDRYIFNNLVFSFPFERSDNLIQFQLSGDTVITSIKPLLPITNESTDTLDIPNIDPIVPTISLTEEQIYKIEEKYPINSNIKKFHPHTIFAHYNKEEVKNLFEEEVTTEQIFGRSLLKSFTTLANYSRHKYGNDVKLLPEPVVIQTVQTNGQFFHFGILQLNTLDLEGNGTKNIWYQTPLLNLFESCSYKDGKPVLEGYNSEVIKLLYTFYNRL